MTRLYMIRHGRPAAAWGGGDDDPGLDPEGARQAREAAQALMSLPPDERPISVVSSPLRRCIETARPLAVALSTDVEIVAEVGEIPTPVGLARGERGAWLRTSLLGRWPDIRGDLDYDLWRRTVYDAIRERPGAAIFSHFVAINAVLSVLEGRDQVIAFRPDHVSVTVLDASGGELRLMARGREAATSVL
jgi:broad specificity phosphatase PhoE